MGGYESNPAVGHLVSWDRGIWGEKKEGIGEADSGGGRVMVKVRTTLGVARVVTGVAEAVMAGVQWVVVAVMGTSQV